MAWLREHSQTVGVKFGVVQESGLAVLLCQCMRRRIGLIYQWRAFCALGQGQGMDRGQGFGSGWQVIGCR